jgi:hypothetical protein
VCGPKAGEYDFFSLNLFSHFSRRVSQLEPRLPGTLLYPNLYIMVRFSLYLALLPFISNVEAFSSINKFSSTSFRRSAFSGTSLNVGATSDEVFPLARSITPEGYGFSSSINRVLKAADRDGGYYKASASDIVADVMDGITDGNVDVALVFDDSSKLVGIFTETDYIKVRSIAWIRIFHFHNVFEWSIISILDSIIHTVLHEKSEI